MKSPWIGILGLVSLFFLPGGCVRVTKSFPEKRYYILDVAQGEKAARAAHGPALRVNKLRVSHRFEGNGMVYRRGELNYEADFYHEFLVPPGSLLTEELSKWLAASGLFQYVTAAAGQIQPTHILEGTVSALYGDFRNGATPRAILEIEFYLLRDHSAQNDILFQNAYAEEVPLREPSPEALVQGWNDALRRILTSLENDLRGIDLAATVP
ncbi:MAG TPA: ABC-type transport auxiliary lipoprotein family protein [Candidatus Binatia bacterium]